MLTYYVVFFGTMLTRLFSTSRKTRDRTLYWLIFALFFLFAAFRYQVGCDWSGYYRDWLQFSGSTFYDAVTHVEPAHWTIVYLLQTLAIPYPYLNVVAGVIFFLGLNSLARRQPDPLAFLVLSFPILIINMAMSAVRQEEAIGLICVAYGAFIDRRPIKFLGFVFLAYLFHQSALVFLFLLPFIGGSFRRINIVSATFLSLPGLYLLAGSGAAELAVSRYVDTGIEAAGAPFRLAILALSGIGYMIYLSKRWSRDYRADYKLVTIGAWLMIGTIGILLISSTIADRFGYYLVPIQLMMFARIPYLRIGRYRQALTVAPYLMLTTVFLVWTQLSWQFQQCYIPYRFLL